MNQESITPAGDDKNEKEQLRLTYFECSAKTGSNVQALFDSVSQQLCLKYQKDPSISARGSLQRLSFDFE